MKTRIFALIMSLFIATMAFAYDAEIDGIYYDLDHENKTAEVTYDENAWDDNGAGYIQSEIVIPEKVTYNGVEYSVTSIGNEAFSNCLSLTSVTIPNSVTSIGYYAFSGCSSLTSVYISDIAAWCNIEFENDMANPLYYAKNLYLNNTKVTDLVIPEGVDSIKDYVFYKCSFLTSITIPNSVTSIGRSAFSGCSSLASVTIPNSVTSIGSFAFYYCLSLTSVTIPNSVTSIGSSAFEECSSLTSIEIPNSVTSIGSWVFADCSSLASVTIGNSVIYLESEVFANCSSLDTLICEFGDDVELDFDEYSGEETEHPLVGTKNLRYFQGPAKLVNTITEEFQTQFSNKLTEVHITDGELDENGFNYINRSKKTLHTIDLAGTTNTAINDLAFYDCYKLENLMLPGNLETIGFKAVGECYQLKEINIPASVVEIHDAAFENCRSIKSITFGGQAEAKSFASRMNRAAASGDVALQRIGNWAFYNCHALENLVIPEGVTEVGDAAFYGCTYLDLLALPSTTQRIGDNCFALCSRMKQINVNATVPPTIFAKTFFDVNRNIPVIVPEGAREAYANDEYWGEFINVVESDEVETQIENAENANVEIYSVGGVLHVDGLSADYQVFDVNGRLVYSGRDAVLSLPRGVYVVVVEGEVEKVVL